MFLTMPKSLLQKGQLVLEVYNHALMHCLWTGFLQQSNFKPSLLFNWYNCFYSNLPFSKHILHSKKANSSLCSWLTIGSFKNYVFFFTKSFIRFFNAWIVKGKIKKIMNVIEKTKSVSKGIRFCSNSFTTINGNTC